MPSALETLVKVLKLEREQGCRNTAVYGGLAAFGNNWHKQANEQAKRPEHYILAEEMVDLMLNYEAIENTTERLKRINYMLDRITGRESIPEEYAAKLEQYRSDAQVQDEQISAPVPAEEKSPESSTKRKKSKKARDRDESSNRESRGSSKQQSAEKFAESADIYDVDLQTVETGELDVKPLPRLSRPPRSQRGQIDPAEQLQRLRELDQPITEVKGIGDKVAEQYASLNLYTINDMLRYLPRRYDDYTALNYIRHLQPNTINTVIGTVEHTEVRVGRGGRKDFAMSVTDGSGRLSVMFFGQHFLVHTIRKGQQVVLSGKVTPYRDMLQMTNPEWESLDSDNLHTTGIVPVYPLTEGITARGLRRNMKRVIDDWTPRIPDPLPFAVLERADLADRDWAVRNLHFPEGWDHLEHARRRYAFDELLVLQLAILRNRRKWQSVPGQALHIDDEFLDTFIDTVFPYALTGAQRRAIDEIRRDVSHDIPMNRLIQGDVGSGKTAVATVAMAMALHNGKQAALMAPTSILAEQHYRNLSRTFNAIPGETRPVIALLTSALSNSERESVYRGISDGSIDAVIGTHALIQEGVEFNDLAVAVVDEQHRFGVEQRARLRGKGTNPHLLVMTATPIPRTLALTVYADLDLTIIDEKPPGRSPVETRLLRPMNRERAFSFIETQLEQGRQAFIVHPLVEASDRVDARSAVEAYEELSRVFYKYRVCLLHGRMKPVEKDIIMADFANHEYDVMVTTSVAEVGVDIPNASVMLIEGANRFGLAQLHQFRGRVGRGEHRSYCLLIPDGETTEAMERLQALEATDDGFRLAEIDWKQRGAGDLLGTRQSGSAVLAMGDFVTPELVALAQQEARTIYETDPDLIEQEHSLLAQLVQQQYDQPVDIS